MRSAASSVVLLLMLATIRPPDASWLQVAAAEIKLEDEEILVAPQQDYHKTSVESKLTSSHLDDDPFALNLEELNTNKKQAEHNDDNDPFSVTFDDFYKEIKTNQLHHSTATNNVAISEARVAKEESIDNSIHKSQTIENDEKRQDPKIDFIFPPPTRRHHDEADEFQQNDQPTEHSVKAKLRPHHPQTTTTATSTKLDDVDEPKANLEFAWKRLLTNQCSRSCGKGVRLYHFFCIDLKFDVRVDPSLCSKASILKPDPMSEAPCNEIDCLPQWDTDEHMQRLCKSDGFSTHCEPYKLVRCIMLDRDGNKVHVDDAKCNATSSQDQLVQTDSLVDRPLNDVPQEGHSLEAAGSKQERDHITKETQNEDTEFVVDYAKFMNDEKNDILSNIDVHLDHHDEQRKSNKSPPMNEPFFQTGPWSSCLDASCGHLGKRYRNITCHIYLSRSAKLVELPPSSCRNSLKPDLEEPCYVDCPNNSTTESRDHSTESLDTDETIYDLEATRYVWRTESWTKCTAECLGGTRESIIECWDKVAERLVDEQLCLEGLRPAPSTESCNQVPCLPEWRVEPFTDCSEPCGGQGHRSRSVLCIQQVPLARGSSSLVVSNDLCIQVNSSMPHTTEPCNREPDCRNSPSKCRLVRRKSGEMVRKCGRRARKRQHQSFSG